MILAVLRAAPDPLDLAAIRHAVGRRYGAPVPRPTIDATLRRLASRGLVGSLDDPGRPRCWLAAPTGIAEGIDPP